MKKILSIDWDYFVDADEDFRVMNFPDGNNRLGNEIQNYIWAMKYSWTWNNDIKVLKDDLAIVDITIDDSMLKSLWAMPLSVNTEHCGILKALADSFSKKETFDIYNVDFHNDAYSIVKGQEPHCGNWLTHLHQNKRVNKAYWIRKDKHYREKPHMPKWMTDANIDIIKDIKFDLVFICHSPAWSPPHLDYMFRETFGPLFASQADAFDRAFPDRWQTMQETIQKHRMFVEEHQKIMKTLGEKVLTI